MDYIRKDGKFMLVLDESNEYEAKVAKALQNEKVLLMLTYPRQINFNISPNTASNFIAKNIMDDVYSGKNEVGGLTMILTPKNPGMKDYKRIDDFGGDLISVVNNLNEKLEDYKDPYRFRLLYALYITARNNLSDLVERIKILLLKIAKEYDLIKSYDDLKEYDELFEDTTQDVIESIIWKAIRENVDSKQKDDDDDDSEDPEDYEEVDVDPEEIEALWRDLDGE